MDIKIINCDNHSLSRSVSSATLTQCEDHSSSGSFSSLTLKTIKSQYTQMCFFNFVKLTYSPCITFEDFYNLFHVNYNETKFTKGFVSDHIIMAFIRSLPNEWKSWFDSVAYKLHGCTQSEVILFLDAFSEDLLDRVDFVNNFYIKQDKNVQIKLNAFYKGVPVSNTKYKKLSKRKGFKTQSFEYLTSILKGLKVALKLFYTLGSVHETVTTEPLTPEGLPIINIARLLIDLVNMVESGFSIINFVNVLLSSYLLIKEPFKVYRTESNEAFVLSMATMMLPKPLYEIIKRASTFTTSKLLDDKTAFPQLFATAIEFIKAMLNYLPTTLAKPLITLLDLLPFGQHYVTLRSIDDLVNKWKKDKTLILDARFRESVKQHAELVKSNNVIEWSKRSSSVASSVKEFSKLVKCLSAYDNTSRIEPVCIVFEGPPKTMKSMVMNNVITCLNKTSYGHIVKTVGDGKDYHDMYENQEVYYCDDLGQQGISQFRTLINLVSSVKFPLDCAQAELKDTKFFNSELIMFTTNHFSSLHGLTKQDGISSISALWRRGFVLDFSKVRADQGKLSGFLSYKWYNPDTEEWLTTSPPGTMLPPNNLNLDQCERKDYLKWIYIIIDTMLKQKRNIMQSATLSDDELHFVRDDLFVDALETEADDDGDDVSYLKQMQELIVSFFNLELFETVYTNSKDYLKIFTLSFLIGLVLYALFVVWDKKIHFQSESSFKLISEEVNKYDNLEHHSTIVMAIQKQLKYVKFTSDLGEVTSVGLMSGHCIVVPYHVCIKGSAVVSVFKDSTATQTEWDKMPVECIYMNSIDDIRIYRCINNIMSPYKNLHHLISQSSSANCLITPDKTIDLHKMIMPSEHVYYKHEETKVRESYSNNIVTSNVIAYKLTASGLCGSLLGDSSSGVIGMHVAAKPGIKGVSILWSANTRVELLKILQQDDKYIIDLEISDRVYDDLSVIRLKAPDRATVSTKQPLIPTPVHGIFPVVRIPAILNAEGPCTIKTLAKKSMQPVGYIPTDDLKFSERFMRTVVQPFKSLSEEEAVGGNEILAPMNKKSANGYACYQDKDKYFDFPNKRLTPYAISEINRIEENIVQGKINYKDIIWVECMKVELRPIAKAKTPRTFRCCTVLMQYITKRIFGNLVSHIMKTRPYHGICVGINPLSEFPKIYDKLSHFPYKWGVDFKKWDGKMLTQLQHSLAIIISENIIDKRDQIIGSFILHNMPHSLILVLDDLFQTTHSMPSGSFLTAILNSMINKQLSAAFYHHITIEKELVPSISHFNSIFVDFLYGDDRLNGSKDLSYNAISMANYFETIGLEVTDDKKNAITQASYDLTELTFLKRSFVYDFRFKKIVPPLSLDTITTSLSFYDKNKDMHSILRDKLDAFQREAYLHSTYESLLNHLQKGMVTKHVEHDFRPDPVLFDMVVHNDPEYITSYSGQYAY